MRRPLLPFAAMAIVALGGCSSGSGSATDIRLGCGSGADFCLSSCSLGCSEAGCAVTQISQNQELLFEFSRELDPATVNKTSISLRNAAGQAPDGSLFVEGNIVRFVPSIRFVGGITTFGFARGETYSLRIRGGGDPGQAVTSLSGARLRSTVVCNLEVSLGVVDPDNKPPVATLVSPAEGVVSADRQPTVTITFDELLDLNAFVGVTNRNSPIRYQLRASRETSPGVRECDPTFSPVVISGAPQATANLVEGTTTVVMRPTAILPGGACVEVIVTQDLRDLAGTPADEQVFQFFVAPTAGSQRTITEDFVGAGRFDARVSSGNWGVFTPAGGSGPVQGAQGGTLGGTGLHGSFNHTSGFEVAPGVWEIDVDNFVAPSGITLTGVPEPVTNGEFHFTDFSIPAGITVRFVGSQAPKVFVRGEVRIEGTVELNGESLGTFQAANGSTSIQLVGQSGGRGGAGGGDGGRGGDEADLIDGTSNDPTGNFNGRDGGDLGIPAGHPLAAQVAGTGGTGSLAWPANTTSAAGLSNPGTTSVILVIVGSGGGGGGYTTAGTDAQALEAFLTTARPGDVGPATPGGSALANYLPKPAAQRSIDWFVIGGAGGGGGGSHPAFGLKWFPPPGGPFKSWRAGAGGGGGGGAVAFRSGRDFRLLSGGAIEARGGGTASYRNQQSGPPQTGGGGSGGSILVQSDDRVLILGTLDVSGGDAGDLDCQFGSTNATRIRTSGGDGAPGFLRLEAPLDSAGTAPDIEASSGTVLPALGADNTAVLDLAVEGDAVTGQRSLWYSTDEIFPPDFVRYEMDVDPGTGGPILTFSDDAAVGMLANDPNQPVMIRLQGAKLDFDTGEPLAETAPSPWVFYADGTNTADPSLDDFSPTGFRLDLLYNKALFPNARVVRFALVFQGS